MQNGWAEEFHSSFIKWTMSLKVYSHCGGWAKKIFLKSDGVLSEEEFEVPRNSTLHGLLEGLHLLVGA